MVSGGWGAKKAPPPPPEAPFLPPTHQTPYIILYIILGILLDPLLGKITPRTITHNDGGWQRPGSAPYLEDLLRTILGPMLGPIMYQ